MTEAQIKYMVDRFLGWRLPANFNPDGGISFKAKFNEHTAHPMKNEPVGTNLFDAEQATSMVRYLVEGLPDADDVAKPVAQYTQGPWVIHREFGGYTIRPAEPVTGAQNICALSTLVPRDGREGATEANAALIAAAPDLLEALRALLPDAEAAAKAMRYTSTPILQARAAISKATTPCSPADAGR